MDTGTWADWASAGANAITAVAAGIAAYHAAQSLSAWRYQLQGEQKLRLAIEALESFHRARDALRKIRSAVVMLPECAGRPRGPNESGDLAELLDLQYAILRRIDNHRTFFEEISLQKFKMIATFGSNIEGMYVELQDILNAIGYGAHFMIPRSSLDPDSQAQAKACAVDLPYADNEMNTRIDALVKRAEDSLRPEIEPVHPPRALARLQQFVFGTLPGNKK